jgi:hypothetical protein
MALASMPMILGAWVVRMNAGDRLRRHLILGTLIVVSAVSIPFEEGWLEFSNDRTPAGVWRVAAPLRDAPDASLVTFDSGVAFCAPRTRLLQGYEMSEFSLVPFGEAELSERFRGISAPRLVRDLARSAEFAVLRGRDLQYLPPEYAREVQQILEQKFSVVKTTPVYGQFGEQIVVLRRN